MLDILIADVSDGPSVPYSAVPDHRQSIYRNFSTVEHSFYCIKERSTGTVLASYLHTGAHPRGDRAAGLQPTSDRNNNNNNNNNNNKTLIL